MTVAPVFKQHGHPAAVTVEHGSLLRENVVWRRSQGLQLSAGVGGMPGVKGLKGFVLDPERDARVIVIVEKPMASVALYFEPHVIAGLLRVR